MDVSDFTLTQDAVKSLRRIVCLFTQAGGFYSCKMLITYFYAFSVLFYSTYVTTVIVSSERCKMQVVQYCGRTSPVWTQTRRILCSGEPEDPSSTQRAQQIF